MRWLSNNAIQYELSQIMKDREVIWVQYSRSSDKPFWVRRARVNGSDAVKYWLNSLGHPYQSIGSFIGTNIINWDAVPELPPSLRSPNNQRKGYKKKWNDYLLPKKCKELGIVWEDLWVGKSMLFDFDDPDNPLEAFDKADKTAAFLKNVLKVKPYMIFSGSKGFHVHLDPEDAAKVAGCKPVDFIDKKDPLRDLGKVYAERVEEIARQATGEKYPIADRSSNFRQGIVRCPYSIHPKTGQVVWPLDEANLIKLRSMDEASIMDIAKALHSWDIPCQSHKPEEGTLTFITPEAKCLDRGLVEWC